MLMFINPSLVSFIPCSPTRRGVVLCCPFRFASGFPPYADLGGPPQPLLPASLTTGELGITGLLWMLVLGETALRLKRLGSKSSSRRRLRRKSPSVGTCGAAKGVEDRELGRSNGLANSPDVTPSTEGVTSMVESSSDIDEAAVWRDVGGGVRYRSSSGLQNSDSLRVRLAGWLKAALAGPTSATFSAVSSASLVAPSCSDGVSDGKAPCVSVLCGTVGSLSRTWRITSASRFASLSIGAVSSISDARIRANVFVFGYID